MDRPPQQSAEYRTRGLLAALLLVGLIACALIVRPFVPALVWALVLALIAAPLEQWLRARLRRAWASATVTLALVTLALIGPALFIANALVAELAGGAQVAGQMLSTSRWDEIARQHTWLAPAIDWANANLEPGLLFQTVSGRLAGWGESLIQGSLTSIATLLLTLYFLFYLLRDGEWFRAAIADAMPLSSGEFARLAESVRDTILASFYGTIAVAALQGLLAGLMFWWLDLPSPAFWGIVMGALAIVPFLGAFVIWAPVAIALAVSGEVGSALILTAWGLLVVGLIDNVIYPILVGKRLSLHSLVSFIAILGGLALFGAHGIVLGPICLASTAMLHRIWRERRAQLAAS